MLGFLSAATVDLVELKDGQMVFRSTRKFPEGKVAQVRVALVPGKLSTVRVHVDSSRPAEKGVFLYVGRALDASPDHEVTGRAGGEALRGAQRHTLGLRVMSRDLPGYHGLTVDLSRTGMQVEISAPLDKGKMVALSLEFDRFDLPRLDTQAEVMWCRSHAVRENNTMGRDNRYRAGMRFQPSGPEQQLLIDQVADFFEQRSHEDLGSLLDRARLLQEEPTAPVLAKARPAVAPKPTGPRKSFILPLDAQISGYRWECTGGLLVVLREPSGDEHGLEFPACQTVRDHGCAQLTGASALRTSAETDLTRWVSEHRGGTGWRHYEFLDAQASVLLDVVSAPCQEYA